MSFFNYRLSWVNSGISFTLVDNSIPVERESIVYNLGSFFSDAGAYLGLLLGLSIVSIYDAVVSFIERIVSK